MASSSTYESILVKLLPEVNNINDLNIAKEFIYVQISSSKIDDNDKMQISCSLDLISSTKELNSIASCIGLVLDFFSIFNLVQFTTIGPITAVINATNIVVIRVVIF